MPFRATMLFLVIAGLLCLPSGLSAQTTNAQIVGDVTDPTGAAIPSATVTATNVATGVGRSVESNEVGQYRIFPLNPATYDVSVNIAGFKTQIRSRVVLEVAAVLEVDFTMELGEVTETVEVTGTSTLSEVFSSDKMGTGTNVSREQIESLPSANRNIQDYIRLDPRISQTSKADGAISAGGQNTRYNLIKIDGVGTSDPFGLESNNLPTERQPVSIDAIEAIEYAVISRYEAGADIGRNRERPGPGSAGRESQQWRRQLDSVSGDVADGDR